MSQGTKDVIAERVLQRADGGEIRLSIGKPVAAGGEWTCQFELSGLDDGNGSWSFTGHDSLEALQLALGFMAVQVESFRSVYGLTLLGSSFLGIHMPDFASMRREAEALPDYAEFRRAFGDPYQE